MIPGLHHRRLARRGSVLLEVLLSMTLFVGAAAFALGATRSVLTALDRSRRASLAVDLARSKLAELESGLVTLAALRDDADGLSVVGSIDAFGEPDPVRPVWEVSVRTQRTEFQGLVLVELTVREVRDDLGDGARGATCTLRQLLSLRGDDAEEFAEDDLLRGLPGLEEPRR